MRDFRGRAAEVSGLLKLLSHPNRLLIACELRDGEASVAALEAATGAAQGIAAWIAWAGNHWTWRNPINTAWAPISAGTVVDGGTHRWIARAGDPEVGV